jgi:hypothetical protein
MNCRWVATDKRRVIPGRHEPDCRGEDCDGCLTCTEQHCGICRRVHANICAECVADTRDNLHSIAVRCGALPAEVAHRGINGEAMMLLGPAADPEAWRNRAMSAMVGRVDDAYLSDCRDEAHPLWVLGTWEQMWRNHLDHPTELEATLPRLVDYLDEQMTYMAGQQEPCPHGERAFVMSGEVGMVTTLTRADRCDRCGAAAQVRVEMTAGELLFCQHHADRYKDCLPSQPTPSPRATTLQSE